MKTKRILALLLALVLSLAITGCSKKELEQEVPPSEQPSEPAITEETTYKEWVWTAYPELDSADPYGSAGAQTQFITNMTFDTLTYVDADSGEVMPELAREWKDVNGDALVWEVKLADGVTFHNGDPLTAEDVKFTWDYTNPDLGNVVKPNAASAYCKSIDVVDEYTVRFNLNSPMPDFASYLETKIYSKNAFDTMDAADAAIIGTGPYYYDLENFKAGVQYVVTRYEDYWQGHENHPSLHIGVRETVDTSTMASMLQAGEIDFLIGFTPSDWNIFASDGNLKTYSRSGAQSYYLGFDHTDPKMQDLKLRKALCQAINKDDIVAIALEGGIGGSANENFCVPTGLGYTEINGVKYDPDAAKVALDELGYGDGLELKLVHYAGECAKMAEVIQANLAEIGVNVTLQRVDGGGTWTAMKSSHEYDMFIDYCSYQGALLYNFNRFFYSNGSSNVNGYASTEYEAMQDNVLNAATWEDMLKEFATLQQWVGDNIPCFPLARNNLLAAARGNVGGMVLAPTTNYLDFSTIYAVEEG